MFRTPAKTAPQKEETSGPPLSNVRRSIGEWEAGGLNSQGKSSITAYGGECSPPAKTQHTGAISTNQAVRRKSAEASGFLANPKYSNLTAEARACLNKAKLHLGNSRNLKTEIKTEVLGAIDRLYQLVKESEQQRTKRPDQPTATQAAPVVDEVHQPEPCPKVTSSNEALITKLNEHSALMQECSHKMEGLCGALKREGEEKTAASAQAGPVHPTYAEAVSQSRAPTTVHSVIVASVDEQDSCEKQELRARVRYRRRVRNPHECHVVLSVSPQGWQKLTDAGRVHVDLQRVQVLDQSPLVQCIRCLRYGHSRKACTEPADLCTHCGGTHLRADCPSRLAEERPACRNCRLASLPGDDHDALDNVCPTRAKWEALARSSVAYC
ncbi:hypothetical protein PYW07_006790 [Mythimna separata]|uniref:CCHC-type domain-containing protein n=1 Tax=Mythimna separata TaxID=271217 RepID=A0AAD8DXY9_MYTSE|nr:hypothetical protein PYW07_006790 [Mythimna separata]